MIYLLYGQPGTGKSTLATGIARDYAMQGRMIASNYPIDFAPVSHQAKGNLAKAHVLVIPSRPDVQHLHDIGIGWRDGEHGREDRSGLFIVDEAGPWLNARNWNDKQRAQIVDWFLHSRKRGWDVVLIAQAPGLLDKQVRDAVIEGYARCRRTDRAKVPLLGIPLPRLHIAVARYGLDPHAPKLESWFYRGSDLHQCYQSYAIFDSNPVDGPYCTIPASLTKWRHHVPFIKRLQLHLAGNLAKPRTVAHPPKHRITRLIEKLPPEQRLYHFRRFESLGAFA